MNKPEFFETCNALITGNTNVKESEIAVCISSLMWNEIRITNGDCEYILCCTKTKKNINKLLNKYQRWLDEWKNKKGV